MRFYNFSSHFSISPSEKMARSMLTLLNRTVEQGIMSALNRILPTILPQPALLTPSPPTPAAPVAHFQEIDFTRDSSILLSRRKMGDKFTSEYINEEDKGYWSRYDKDLKQDILLDHYAECPRWMVNRRAREWRPDLPRFIEGVIVELMTIKPKKPNSGNRKCCKVQITVGDKVKVVRCRIPGERNTLQQHHRVLIQYSRHRNLPLVKFVVVRGQLDAKY